MALEPITRMEKILAGEKIAPVTRREYFVQEAIQNGGGSGETYETVAEIQVGEMEEKTGLYGFDIPSEEQPVLEGGQMLFFNDPVFPLEYSDDEITAYAYNLDPVTGEPKGTPAYAVILDEGKGTIIVSDTDLSNTTVRILKKVEQGDGDGKVLTVTFTPTSLTSGTADVSFDEIKTAFAQGKNVLVHIPGDMAVLGYTYAVASINGSRVFGVGIENESLSLAILDHDEENSYYFQVKPIPRDLKATKEFGFTVTAGQEAGTFVVTPDSGSTYAAITAAISETPNVLCRFAFGSETYVAPVSHIGTDFYNCYTNIYGDVGAGSHFYVARLRIEDDDTMSFAIEQIGA